MFSSLVVVVVIKTLTVMERVRNIMCTSAKKNFLLSQIKVYKTLLGKILTRGAGMLYHLLPPVIIISFSSFS